MDDPMQQIAKMEAELARLRAAVAPPAALPPRALSQADLQAVVQAELAKYAPRPAAPAPSPMQALMPLFQKVLTPEELQWFQQHIGAGAPGLVPFVESDDLAALIRMLYEEYRAFLARPPK